MSNTAPAPSHLPVLLDAVVELAAGAGRVVDATLGHGGHALALLDRGAEVLGIDRDPEALAIARSRIGDRAIRYLNASFFSDEAVEAVTLFRPDFILMDLGVSSRQLDDESRGFTFRPGAALDMRMSDGGMTAAEWLAEADEEGLARVFREWGDEPRARRLAAEIGRRRRQAPFLVSDDLVNAIRAVLGPRSGPGDFARLFQAVRIEINGELDGLAAVLPRFRDALVPGGRLAVISYHSGEDRLVKHAFRDWSNGCVCPPRIPQCICGRTASGSVDPRRAVTPDEAEIAHNPRARSARLRGFRVSNAAQG